MQAFINEYISEDSLEKYNMGAIDKRTSYGSIATNFWVVNKEQHIWLRELYVESDHTAHGGGYSGISYWNFYWKGHLMTAKIKLLEAGGKRGEHRWARKKLLDLSLPAELEDKHDLVLKDLEAALTEYKEAGVLSKSTSYKLTFEV